MNGHTIGAIMENYGVARLAGHNVMHYNDSLKGDNVHVSSEPHYKVFQNSHFAFFTYYLSTIFFEIHEISVAKETGTNMYDIFS